MSFKSNSVVVIVVIVVAIVAMKTGLEHEMRNYVIEGERGEFNEVQGTLPSHMIILQTKYQSQKY